MPAARHEWERGKTIDRCKHCGVTRRLFYVEPRRDAKAIPFYSLRYPPVADDWQGKMPRCAGPRPRVNYCLVRLSSRLPSGGETVCGNTLPCPDHGDG